MQLVADVQNAAALAGELAQHHKQLVHCLGREHRGRFIQNQNRRIGQKGADDFHTLHFAHAERVHRALGVHVQPVVSGFGNNQGAGFVQRRAGLQTQPDVLGHRGRIKEIEVLKHHGHAQGAGLARIGDVHPLAVHPDFACIHLHAAVDDFHQRGLARPVFTQDRMDLAGHQGQRHPIVGHRAGVGFGDTG